MRIAIHDADAAHLKRRKTGGKYPNLKRGVSIYTEHQTSQRKGNQLKTVKCTCGGNALTELQGYMVSIRCDKCGYWVASFPEPGEPMRRQMERVVKSWNEEQRMRRSTEMTEQKLCPLKRGRADDFIVFQNVNVEKKDLEKLRETGAVVLKSRNSDEPKVEVISGICDGPRCAWWDAERNCCSVVSMERMWKRNGLLEQE